MRRHHATRGFTLVELLVVLGIVALLIGFLLPTLIAARRRALSVKCLSTERQIAQAAMIQALWHRGYVQLGGAQWVLNAAGTAWAAAMPATVGDPYANRYTYYADGGVLKPMPFFASCAQLMNVRLDTSSRASLQASLSSGDALHAFVCPSQSSPQFGTSVSDRSGWTSPPEAAGYLLNEEVVGFRNWNPNTPHGLLRKVLRSSDVLFFADGNPRARAEPLFSIWAVTTHDTLSTFAAYDKYYKYKALDFVRHQGSINIVFCDGHAATFNMGTPDRLKLGTIPSVLIGVGS